MVNRQQNKKSKAKSKKRSKLNETYSAPNIVDEPKDPKGVNRENNENDLFNDWIHNIQKLSKHDLGVINHSEEYPNAKKDRSYNYGVQRAKDDLKLLHFLLYNLKPYYKNQIMGSSQLDNIIKQYMGIDEYDNDEPTEDEKKMMVLIASKMLVNSITTIQKHMPPPIQ